VKPIDLEPPRFAMTGGGFSVIGLRRDFLDEAKPIDAPLYSPRGSLIAGHVTFDGKVYVAASELIDGRYP
jgi:hypothetical protein